MRKSVKRIWIVVLAGVELMICAAIVLSLAVLQPTLPTAQLFYSAVVGAEETVDERVPVSARASGRPLELRLSNLHGDVRVVPGPDDEVIIRALKQVWGQDQQDAQTKLEQLRILTEAGEGTLTVRVEEPPEFHLFSLITRSSRVTFEVAVPRNTSANLSTRDGDIGVQGIQGGVELTNRFGAVHVEDVAGDVVVDARDEDVTVQRSGAPGAHVELHTRFSDLTVQQVAAGEMVVENRDGAVSLEDLSVEGDLSVNARFGGVELARVQAADIRIEADDGRLNLEDVQSAGELDIACKFDEVSVSGVAATTLVVDVHDGSLVLEDVDIEREGAVTSRYVSVDLRNVRARTLTIKGQDRDINLENVQLETKLDVSSQHGAVRVSETAASEFRIETRDDSIFLDRASGLLWLRNHYGDVSVTGAREAALDVEVQDGTFTFEGTLDARADHRIDGSSGDVNLDVPGDTAVRLDAQTRFGRIQCDLPISVEKTVDEDAESTSDSSRLLGSINGGRAKLWIKLRNGDIAISEASWKLQ